MQKIKKTYVSQEKKGEEFYIRGALPVEYFQWMKEMLDYLDNRKDEGV